MRITIYLLRRQDGTPIYVGKTNDLTRRLREHKTKLGFAPISEVLEVCGEEWPAAEIRWTTHYQGLGFDLLNRMVGDARGVQTHSADTRAALSRRGRGKRKPAGFGDKVRAALRGRPKNWTPEGAEARRKTQLVAGEPLWNKLDEGQRARVIAALRSQSGEKISADLRERWAAMTDQERQALSTNRSASWAKKTPLVWAEIHARKMATREATAAAGRIPKPVSDLTRQRMAEAAKARWAKTEPEERARRTSGIRDGAGTVAARQKALVKRGG